MAQFLNDTFTDTSGTTLASHTGETGATWTQHGSFAGALQISSANRCRKSDTSNAVYHASGSPAGADYEVVATVSFVTVLANDFVGPAGRINTGANTFYWVVYAQSAGQIQLRKNVAGSITTLGTASMSPSNGDTWLLKLRMVGTTIKALSKGPLDADYVEQVSVTDSAISAAGKAGVVILNSGGQSDSTGGHVTTITGDDILSGPTASFVSASETTINVSTAAPGSGTGPFTYQWYRSTTSGFTPGAGNILSGATSTTLADTASLVSGTVYFYKVVSTSSDGSPQVLTSNQVAGGITSTTRKLGFLGDSITNGSGVATKPGTLAVTKLAILAGRSGIVAGASATDQGVNGSQSSDWISGSGNLGTAKTAFASASVTHVHIMLGTNDSKDTNAVSASTFLSNLTSCVNDLVGAGYKVVLSYPPGHKPDVSSGFTETSLGRLQTYLAQIDSLINGSTILRGSTLPFVYFAENTSLLASDGIHMSTNGNDDLSRMWAEAFDEIFNTSSSGGVFAKSRLTNAGG